MTDTFSGPLPDAEPTPNLPAALDVPTDKVAPAPLGAPLGSELYPAPPPRAEDVLGALGASRRQFLDDLPAQVVDPTISTRDRLFSGAAVYSGSKGADLDTYQAWREQQSAGMVTPPPPRPGATPAQAKIMANPGDRSAQARAMTKADDMLAARIGGWIADYEQGAKPSAPVDVARFDRIAKDGVLGDGRTKRLYTKLLDGTIGDVDVPELSSRVAAVAEALHAFGDDGTIGANGKLVTVDADAGDVRLRVRYSDTGDEPVSSPGALQALPGDWMPQSALRGDGPRGTDVDLYVGPADAVVIGKADQRLDDVYRKGFPALEADGGARWMAARPVLLHDLTAVDRAADRNPTARVDVHFGLYPGFFPYDSMTFEMEQSNQRVEVLGAVRLGRGVVHGPRLSPRGVVPEDLTDERTVGKLMDETMWALFPGDAKLHPRYTAIPVTSGDRSGRLVFGMTPGEASEVAEWAFVNDGIATRRDDYDQLVADAEGGEYWKVATGDHKGATFAVSLDESPLVVERRSRSVDRWHLPIDERARPYVRGLADHFESAGASNVAVYLSQPELDGFERVREHVYADGGSGYTSARTADPVIGDPNGLPVWVRRADELPRRWLQVDPDVLDSRVEEMTATQRAGRWRVDARGLDDIAAQVRSAHVLAGRYGYDAVELVGDDGPITLGRPKR